MNTAVELLRTVQSEGGELWVQGGKLGYRVPRHLTRMLPRLAELRAELLLLVASAEKEPPAGEPSAWEEELEQWALAQCGFHDRAWGGVVALHNAYVDWSHETGHIPPATLVTFRRWLRDQGLVLTGPLVVGLVLAEDMKHLPECF